MRFPWRQLSESISIIASEKGPNRTGGDGLDWGACRSRLTCADCRGCGWTPRACSTRTCSCCPPSTSSRRRWRYGASHGRSCRAARCPSMTACSRTFVRRVEVEEGEADGAATVGFVVRWSSLSSERCGASDRRVGEASGVSRRMFGHVRTVQNDWIQLAWNTSRSKLGQLIPER